MKRKKVLKKKSNHTQLIVFIVFVLVLLFAPIPQFRKDFILCDPNPCGLHFSWYWSESVFQMFLKQLFDIKPKLDTTTIKNINEKDAKTDCGIYPDEVFAEIRKQVGDLTKSGPTWSSDCKHVAWSQRKVPRDGLATDENGDIKSVSEKPELNKFEGVYLYDVRSKKTVRIYEPGEPLTRPSFDRWIDNNTLQYYVYGTTQIYSLR